MSVIASVPARAPDQVPERVLDLFAVPDAVRSLDGGQGRSVVAGDLVLSPGRDPRVQAWLSPVLARLAVRMDERPGRTARDLRIAVPVPARDGSWVVDGWGASRFEPGTRACSDVGVVLAAGRVLHAELAAAIPTPPAALAEREDRWAVAERRAFGPPAEAVAAATRRGGDPLASLVGELTAVPADGPGPGVGLGRDQLVHADLAGNVLLDGSGAPVVIDVAPAWRPVAWAEAVCRLDAAAWHDPDTDRDPDPAGLGALDTAAERRALSRAAVFRLLSDPDPDVGRYRALLAPLLC